MNREAADKKFQALSSQFEKKAKVAVDKTVSAANQAVDLSKDAAADVKAKAEKATAPEERIPAFDPTKFPPEWKDPRPPLGPATVVGMHQKFEDYNPKVFVVVHTGKHLKHEQSFVTAAFGQPEAEKLKSKLIKGTINPTWDAQGTLALHKVTRPTTCFITVYAPSKVGDQKIGYCEVDLVSDLHMSTKGDSRRWQFRLTPVGWVDVSFVACSNLQFPAICLPTVGSFSGMLQLPKPNPLPQFEFTLFQIVGLRGKKAPSPSIEVVMESYLPDGTYGREVVIDAPMIKKCFYPYWNLTTTVTINTRYDKMIIFMTESAKSSVLTTRKITLIEFDLKGIFEYASVSESRNWFVLEKGSRPGFLGLGFRALHNMDDCEPNLPTTKLDFSHAPSQADALNPDQQQYRPPKEDENELEDEPAGLLGRTKSRLITKKQKNELDEMLAWVEHEENPQTVVEDDTPSEGDDDLEGFESASDDDDEPPGVSYNSPTVLQTSYQQSEDDDGFQEESDSPSSEEEVIVQKPVAQPPKKKKAPINMVNCVLCKGTFPHSSMYSFMDKLFCTSCSAMVKQRQERIEAQQQQQNSPGVPRAGSQGIQMGTGPGRAFLRSNEEAFLHQQQQIMVQIQQLNSGLAFCQNPMEYQLISQQIAHLKTQLQISPQELQSKLQSSGYGSSSPSSSPRIGLGAGPGLAGHNRPSTVGVTLKTSSPRLGVAARTVAPAATPTTPGRQQQLCDICKVGAAQQVLGTKNLCVTCHGQVVAAARAKGIGL